MHEWYERTALTPLRAARATGFIDWNLQPSPFKSYPEGLFSYDLESTPALRCVDNARRVTSQLALGGRPYLRLNTPSAGNLHPVELYVQVRGVPGVIAGIYHVDARRRKLVLLREVEADGLEPLLGLEGRFKGMLFLTSCVPFRSAWKYGERSWRYCHLDAGHQIGALQAALALDGQEPTILSGFDADCLDRVMGFGGEEFVAAAVASGTFNERPCKAVETPLLRVQPTDYSEENGCFEAFARHRSNRAPALAAAPFPAAERLEAAIGSRRSARGFDATPIADESMERLMHLVSQPPQPLVCHAIVLRGGAFEPGLYQGGRMVRGGTFTESVTSLLVNQPFVSTSSLVLILGASAFSADTLMTAGAYAHTLHLHSYALRLGFSGVGAFFDRDLRRFLESDDCILYTLVIGNDPQLISNGNDA